MLRIFTSFSQQNFQFKSRKVINFLTLVKVTLLMSGVLLPPTAYSQTTQTTEESLMVQARRCRYYQVRTRAGDTRIYALLVMQQENSDQPTGAEQCLDIVDRYLSTSDLSEDEIRVYEFVQQYYRSLIERIPKDNKKKEQT